MMVDKHYLRIFYSAFSFIKIKGYYSAGVYQFKVNIGWMFKFKRQNKLWSLFKVNNKDTRTTSLKLFWLFIVNFVILHISSVFIVDFQQAKACWKYIWNLLNFLVFCPNLVFTYSSSFITKKSNITRQIVVMT